jgi:hypothetical protein
MARQKFLKWCSTTLLGHLVLFALPFWIVMSVIFLIANYVDGTLTVAWAFYILWMGLLIAVICAVLVWFTLTSPLIKATNQKQKQRDLDG